MTENDILLPDSIMGTSVASVGCKTLSLKRALDWGYNVPRFVALPCDTMQGLLDVHDLRNETARKITKILRCENYAVRSSALSEDGRVESMAGRFLTETNIARENLSDGIHAVIKHALNVLSGDISRFSLIVQEYVAPDVFGVLFTRNPIGSREMVVEYGLCAGEEIVGGKIKPKKYSFYWNETRKNAPLFLGEKLVEDFKRLELEYGFPQDIEWCIRHEDFYLLQSRPITTITEKQYDQITALEKLLPRTGPYYFEKTEVTEIAPRPTRLTFGLLKAIYSQAGPIASVYAKHGVKYRDTGFLRIIGNELFIDKEKEMKGILPSAGYLRNTGFVPKIEGLSGISRTLLNAIRLNRIRTSDYEDIYRRLKCLLETSRATGVDFRDELENFIRDYELIFETNLLAGLSLKKAHLFLKNEPVNLSEILSCGTKFADLEKYKIEISERMTGNSIEFADDSDFYKQEITTSSDIDHVESWWSNLSEVRKQVLEKVLFEAVLYSRFREFGRWLTVKNICSLRAKCLKIAKESGFIETRNIYHSDLADILASRTDENVCISNKDISRGYDRYDFPSPLVSSFIPSKSAITGVSPGVATGVVVDRTMMERGWIGEGQTILYSESLSPDLVQYFGKISGIIAANGGLLSHLAILARERHVPVIVGCSISDHHFRLSDNVRIDANRGVITRI